MYVNQIITLIPKTPKANNIIRNYGSSWTISSVFRGTKAPSVYVYSNGQYHRTNTTMTIFQKNDPDFDIQE